MTALTSSDGWQAVAKVGDIRKGDVVAVVVAGLELVVGLDGDTYFATQRRCVHQGGDLAEGIVSRGHLICPNHGWRFSTATGMAPESSEYCLRRYAVRVVGESIEVDPRQLPPAAS